MRGVCDFKDFSCHSLNPHRVYSVNIEMCLLSTFYGLIKLVEFFVDCVVSRNVVQLLTNECAIHSEVTLCS